MTVKMIILVLIISLIPFFNAFSQEKTIEGEISATGKYVGVKGEGGGEAKFTEYRDLQENGGIYGRTRLKFDTEKKFLNFDAGDFGYDTQYYKMDGGIWGKFKVDLFYNEIPHNIAFDAKTTFEGAGSDALTGTPNTNISSWDTFDYSFERRQYGGGLKVNMIKPFFFDVSFQREERDGIKPTGAAQTSPGGIAFELPEPVNYTTNNLNVEGGYAQKPFFLSFNCFLSEYNNGNTSLNLPSNFNAPRAFSLPPDNTYYKGAFKGGVNLPYNSKFSTKIGLSKGKSDTSILSLISSDYEGKVDTRNYDFVLSSNPIRFLDTKFYYKFYKWNNKSEDSLGVIEKFLDYEKKTSGADLGLKLPAQFYLSGGYKYVKTERDDEEGQTDLAQILPFNKDNIYSIDLRWSGLDFMTFKVGYEKLDRDADYQTSQSEARLDRLFSYAEQDRDTYKASLEVFPLDNLNFGFDYQHKKTDYADTTYGLLQDKRDEFNISADYTVGNMAKLYGYSDYGIIKFVQMTNRPAGSSENRQKDKSYGYGLGTKVYVIPQKFTLIFQHDYLKSNGSVDLTYNNSGLFADAGITGANNDIIDISRWDDYTRYSFKLKGVYNFRKSLTASAGYGYERFKYSDVQLDGYQYVPATSGTNGAYLTGAYKDQSYRAHLIFAGVTYKF